ncbi:hypothetical protein DCC39_04690 [Pueribacillus theae]|uniref:NAD-dependent epimerase/dehydratase domain-containing protein n=1 Tax=Pueribacillus theae TaxID=2171751 RepID=A0A2U1K5E6_9BACI|nr:NAD(P)-dependent oxidoreductase [Pueribacillus theae]PWA12736.1 hypothetical protein DCC39_04690 [Pueribacillus theae]
MQKAVVTGALEFFGFHTCVRLLEESVEVIGIDSLKDNRKVKEEMLLSIGRNSLFQFIDQEQADLNHLDAISGADVFFHFADWPLHVANVDQVTAFCAQEQIPLVFLSTIDVYEKQESLITEETSLKPESTFGKRKMQEEALLLDEAKKGKFPLIIFRLPFVYGPWLESNSLLHDLLQTKHKAILELEGCKDLERQSMYIEDVVEAIWLAVNRGYQLGQIDIYNLSNDEQHISNEKVKNHLSFIPSYSLEEGLKKYNEHVQKVMNHNPSLYD